MGSRLAVFAAVAFVLVACKGSSTPVVEAPVVSSSASGAPPPSPTPSAAASTATPSDPTKHCMMVNVCSCNLGCAAIRAADLKVGTRAKSESGVLVGQELKVIEMTDVTGTKVLALTDLTHDHACSLPVERSLAGYGCAKADSGPIPAKACAKGCL